MSPRHRQLLVAPEVLVRARSLCGAFPGGAVDAGLTEVTCHPLLYDRHEVILAEGAPTESFHPGETGLSALTPEAWAEV